MNSAGSTFPLDLVRTFFNDAPGPAMAALLDRKLDQVRWHVDRLIDRLKI